MTDDTFYIRMRGLVSGPLSRDDLHNMVRLGTFSRAHEISRDGCSWHSAMDVGEMFERLEVLAADEIDVDIDAPVPAPDEHETVEIPQKCPGGQVAFATKLQRLSLVEGLCAAGVLMFCALIPYTRHHGRLIWWWNSGDVEGGGLVALASAFALAAAVALIFVATLLKGLGRGWAYIAIGGVGIFLLGLTAAIGLDGGFIAVRILSALAAGYSLTALLVFGLLEVLTVQRSKK